MKALQEGWTLSGAVPKAASETVLQVPHKFSLYFPFMNQHHKRKENKGNLRLRLSYCINTFHPGCDSCPRVLLCFVNIYQLLQHPHNMGTHSWQVKQKEVKYHAQENTKVLKANSGCKWRCISLALQSGKLWEEVSLAVLK